MKETPEERLQWFIEANGTAAGDYTHITKRKIQQNIHELYIQYSMRIIGV